MWRTVFGIFVVLFLGITSTAAETVRLEQRSILNGKIEILLPAAFKVMDKEMMQLKYPSERRPTIVYTNPAGSVNVAFNHTKSKISPEKIPAMHKYLESTFKNLYPSAKWFDSNLIQINGRRYLMLDVRTPAIDTEIRNMIVGTSFEGRLLLLTFNAVRALEETWVPVGTEIIQSIKISQ